MNRKWWGGGFVSLWACQVLGQVGDHLVYLSVTVLVFRTFGTGAALGTYYLVRALPSISIGPVAGVFVDMSDRKRLAIGGYGLSLMAACLLFFARSTWSLMGCVLCNATAAAVVFTALQAMLPQVVCKEKLLAANSIISATGSIARFVAPAASAILVVWIGERWAFVIAALFYFCAGISLAPLRLASPEPGTPLTGVGVLALRTWMNLVGGLRYLLRSRILLGVTVVTSLVMFADSAVSPIFAILVDRVLNVPPEFIGYLSSTYGIGTILGAAALPLIKARTTEQRLLSIGVFLIAGQMLVYSRIPLFWLALPLQLISGCGFAFVLNTTRTLFQAVAPRDVVGRAVAASIAFSSLLNLVALKAGGLLADHAGPRMVFFVAGILCMGCAVLSLYLLKVAADDGQALNLM